MESTGPRISPSANQSREGPRFRTFLFLAWAIIGAFIVAGLAGAMWRLSTNAYYAYRPKIEWNEFFEDTIGPAIIEENIKGIAEASSAGEKADDEESAKRLWAEAHRRAGERITENINQAIRNELRNERKRRLDAVFMYGVLVTLAAAATLGWFFAGIHYRIWIDTSPPEPSRPPAEERHPPNDTPAPPAEPDPADVIADLLKDR